MHGERNELRVTGATAHEVTRELADCGCGVAREGHVSKALVHIVEVLDNGKSELHRVE